MAPHERMCLVFSFCALHIYMSFFFSCCVHLQAEADLCGLHNRLFLSLLFLLGFGQEEVPEGCKMRKVKVFISPVLALLDWFAFGFISYQFLSFSSFWQLSSH